MPAGVAVVSSSVAASIFILLWNGGRARGGASASMRIKTGGASGCGGGGLNVFGGAIGGRPSDW